MRSSQKSAVGPPKEEPLTASALREQLSVFAKDVLQRELAQLKASIIEEQSRNKVSILEEISYIKNEVIKGARTEDGLTQNAEPPRQMDQEQVTQTHLAAGGVQEVPSPTKVPDAMPENQSGQPLLGVDGRTIDIEEQADADGGWASPAFQSLSRFVKSHTFDNIASCFVLCGLAWLTYVTEYNAINWLHVPPREFIWVEVLFCAVFALESSLRLLVLGCDEFFCGRSWKSNVFDLVLVFLQVLDTVIEITGFGATSKLSAVTPFIRILRLFRIFRVIRIFRFFPDLRMLVVSVIQSFQPLLWVLALIFFVTTSFAIVITVIVTEHKTKFTREEWNEKGTDELDLQLFFGSVVRSSLSLYGAIAGGRDWHASAEPLTKYIDERLIIAFLLYTFFVIFAMMNVITSQFVDTTLEASAQDRRESIVSNLMETFSNSSGRVTEIDFMNNLQDSSMKSFLKDLYKRDDVSAQELRRSRLFEMLDDDKSGWVSKEELVLGCVNLTGTASSLELAALKIEVKEIRNDMQQIIVAVGGKPRSTSRASSKVS